MRKAVFALLASLPLGLAGHSAPAGAEGLQSSERWTFGLTPYFWVAGISGDVHVPTRLHPGGGVDVDLDADFSDLFKNISAIPIMAMAEAQYGRFGLIGDILFLQIETDGETQGPAFGSAETRLTTTIGSAVGTYRAIDERWHTLEFGAGARVWSVSTKVELGAGTLPGGSAKKSATWVDPILAVRYRARLADRWALTVYGDVGGFGVGSEFAWMAHATVDFAAASWLDLRVGYRHLGVEYDGNRARYDLDFSGPFLGATFKF